MKLNYQVKLFYFLVCIAIISCKTSNELKSDLDKDGLNGRIKRIQIITYKGEQKFGEIQKSDPVEPGIRVMYDPTKIIFDSNSPETANTVKFYDLNGFEDSIYYLTYHDSVLLIQNKGFDTVRNINIRNNNHFKTIEYWISNPSRFSLKIDTFCKKEFFYNSNKKIDSIAVFNKYPFNSAIYFNHYKYKYDDINKKRTMTYFNTNNTIDELTKVIDSVLMKKILVYKADGSLLSEEIQYYDSNNNIVKTIKKEFGKINKEVIENRQFVNGIINNRSVKIISKTEDWELQNENYEAIIENKYEYKYDTFNNWIECIRVFEEIKDIQGVKYNNSGYHLIIRTIDYYN